MFPYQTLPPNMQFHPYKSFPITSICIPTGTSFLSQLGAQSVEMQGSVSSGVFHDSSSFNSSLFDSSVFGTVKASVLVITEGLRGSVVFQLISALIFGTPFDSTR